MKIGLMSFAHMHADGYLPLLLSAPGVQVMGAADDDAARGRERAAHHGVRYFETYAALLAERPEAVVVCSENARHRAHVELAAAAGAHVLCEKPLAPTRVDAEAMVASLARLSELEDQVRVYPGHGADTTIGRERPWLELVRDTGRLIA